MRPFVVPSAPPAADAPISIPSAPAAVGPPSVPDGERPLDSAPAQPDPPSAVVVVDDGWPQESTAVDTCPSDADGNGVHDVVAMWRPKNGPARLVIADGATGTITKAVDRAIPRGVELTCIGGPSFALKAPDELELWSVEDLGAARRVVPATRGGLGVSRIGDGCISADPGPRGAVHLDARTFADASACEGVDTYEMFGRLRSDRFPRFGPRHAVVFRTAQDGELEVEAFDPVHWQRGVRLMPSTTTDLAFAMTRHRLWVLGRARNTEELRLVGLDRADGRTIVERPAASAAFRFFVADDVHLLYGTGAVPHAASSSVAAASPSVLASISASVMRSSGSSVSEARNTSGSRASASWRRAARSDQGKPAPTRARSGSALVAERSSSRAIGRTRAAITRSRGSWRRCASRA